MSCATCAISQRSNSSIFARDLQTGPDNGQEPVAGTESLSVQALSSSPPSNGRFQHAKFIFNKSYFLAANAGQAQIDWVVSRPIRASPLRTIANFAPIGPMTS